MLKNSIYVINEKGYEEKSMCSIRGGIQEGDIVLAAGDSGQLKKRTNNIARIASKSKAPLFLAVDVEDFSQDFILSEWMENICNSYEYAVIVFLLSPLEQAVSTLVDMMREESMASIDIMDMRDFAKDTKIAYFIQGIGKEKIKQALSEILSLKSEKKKIGDTKCLLMYISGVASLMDSGQALNEIMEGMPEDIRVVYGMNRQTNGQDEIHIGLFFSNERKKPK